MLSIIIIIKHMLIKQVKESNNDVQLCMLDVRYVGNGRVWNVATIQH